MITAWSPRGHPMITSWSPRGHLMVTSWSPHGHLMVTSWSPHGHLMVTYMETPPSLIGFFEAYAGPIWGGLGEVTRIFTYRDI